MFLVMICGETLILVSYRTNKILILNNEDSRKIIHIKFNAEQ